MLVVSDTSPLRALQVLGLVHLLERLYGRVIVPRAVAAELAVDAGVLAPFNVGDYGFMSVVAATERAVVERFEEQVDAGEAEAIAVAVELHADLLLVDDLDGRALAKRVGLRTTGVLGVLVDAKASGLIAEVRPLVAQLVAVIGFRVSASLLERVLRDAGEGQ